MMAGGPKGAAIGALTILAGSIFNAVRQKNTNEKSTQLAYAGLWQQRATTRRP